MESLLQDLRYGFRILFRNPGFTVIAVFSLALGIGANSTIFSVIHTVMLLTPILSNFLFGVKAHDPVTFIGVSLILLSISLLATYIPARKATTIDPRVALRYE